MKKVFQSALVMLSLFVTVAVSAQKKDIVDIAAGSASHTTLVAVVKAADLVVTLKGDGPFTVFAPVNEAFANLPAGTVESLLMTENKATLAKILTYHVVAGNLDAKAVIEAIKKGKGNVNHSAHLWGALYGLTYTIILKPSILLEFYEKIKYFQDGA